MKIHSIAAVLALAALVSVDVAFAQESAFPSKWRFVSKSKDIYQGTWLGEGRTAPATDAGTGYITAERCAANAGKPLDYKLASDKMPCADGFLEGDSWTFHFPVKSLKKGSYVELDLIIGTNPHSPRYLAVEYFDGGVWKQSEADLNAVPDKPSLFYNVKCSGRGTEHVTVLQTVRFSKPVRGEALIRLRVVGDIACDGSPLSVPGGDGAMRFLSYGYIGAYADMRGTDAPADTTKVGMIGNSFTFVNASDFMLKELAWYEGHYLDMYVSTYAGANFRRHTMVPRSLDVMTRGGYDWFILQDLSSQTPRYGAGIDQSFLDYTKTVASLVRHFTPDCKLLYEKLWSFRWHDFYGYGSFEKYDSLATVGAAKLSEAIKAKSTHVGDAFAIARRERPELEKDLYSTDDHHPGAYGAYVKACVDYLEIFGIPFKSNKANFALDPEKCAYLRRVAERVCLEGEALKY